MKVLKCALQNSLQIRRRITVATTAGNKVALLRRCTDAAATAAKRRRAAFGLALVILEHKKVVRSDLNIGTQ